MSELWTVLAAVVPVVLVVLSGWGMRRLEWLTAEADASLLRITVNVMMPCLVLDSLLGNPALGNPRNLFLPPLIGWGTVTLGLVIAGLVRRWIPARTPATRRTFAFSVSLYNYGYIPLPLALALFGRDTVAVLFVHNIGVEVALWVYGLMLLAGHDWRRGLRRLFSPPLVAIVSTLLLNLLVPREAVPSVVLQAAHWLGQCAIPLGVILIGATMADHAHEFASRQGGREMVLACVLRLGVLPVVFLALARWLPLPLELRQVMLLQAAMPAAVFPIIMARHYGGDPATALRVVVATSAVGLVTIPLWIRFGMQFLQL